MDKKKKVIVVVLWTKFFGKLTFCELDTVYIVQLENWPGFAIFETIAIVAHTQTPYFYAVIYENIRIAIYSRNLECIVFWVDDFVLNACAYKFVF